MLKRTIFFSALVCLTSLCGFANEDTTLDINIEQQEPTLTVDINQQNTILPGGCVRKDKTQEEGVLSCGSCKGKDAHVITCSEIENEESTLARCKKKGHINIACSCKKKGEVLASDNTLPPEDEQYIDDAEVNQLSCECDVVEEEEAPKV